MAAPLWILLFWRPLSADASDILWYTGDGGASATSLTTLTDAAGECSSGLAQTTLWPADLETYRLIFLSVTSDTLTSSQTDALADYLADGRTLVLVGDSAWFNVPHVETFNTLLEDLAIDSRFVEGVSYDAGCLQQATVETSTALTEGVGALTYAYSGDIDLSGGTLLFEGESGQALVVAHDNLILAADINIFEESCAMGPGNPVFFANLYRGACLTPETDADGDGFVSEACGGEDCDDRDATLRPDRAWYPDQDGDGLGDPALPTLSCCPIADMLDSGEDCDDTNPEILWGDLHYTDADGDGHGDPARFVRACLPPSGTVATGDDCDDTRATVSPSAAEVCNDIDDSCDGQIDEPGAQGERLWYPDRDGDGYGQSGTEDALSACDAIVGRADNAEDCNDGSAAIHPAAAEDCNRIDDNCDGQIDEDSACEDDSAAPSHQAAAPETGCGGRRSVVLGLLLSLGALSPMRRTRSQVRPTGSEDVRG